MLKKLRALLGIKPNKSTYKRVSDILHYGGKMPKWAEKYADYKKGDTLAEVFNTKDMGKRKFIVTQKHLTGGK